MPKNVSIKSSLVTDVPDEFKCKTENSKKGTNSQDVLTHLPFCPVLEETTTAHALKN